LTTEPEIPKKDKAVNAAAYYDANQFPSFSTVLRTLDNYNLVKKFHRKKR